MADIGRPTVMTAETIEKLEYVFSLGGSDEEACFFANIGMRTLYDYQTANPEFAQRKKLLKERPILLARESVVKGLENDPELALKFLKNKRNKEFSERQELTGEDGKALTLTMIVNAPRTDNGVQSNDQAVPSMERPVEQQQN